MDGFIKLMEFVFQDFWHWLGFFFLCSVVFGGLYGIFKNI